MRSSFLHASAILFSSVLVHLCVVNSTVNEWSDSVVVCATSCEVTQAGKFCKHTRMLCKHFYASIRAKSRGFAPVSCVYCKPGLRCPGTLFISHEHANFLFSVFRVVQGEAKTPKIMGCCRAIFAFLQALKIGTFRGK